MVFEKITQAPPVVAAATRKRRAQHLFKDHQAALYTPSQQFYAFIWNKPTYQAR
jgi:hypothetical protein